MLLWQGTKQTPKVPATHTHIYISIYLSIYPSIYLSTRTCSCVLSDFTCQLELDPSSTELLWARFCMITTSIMWKIRKKLYSSIPNLPSQPSFAFSKHDVPLPDPEIETQQSLQFRVFLSRAYQNHTQKELYGIDIGLAPLSAYFVAGSEHMPTLSNLFVPLAGRVHGLLSLGLARATDASVERVVMGG